MNAVKYNGEYMFLFFCMAMGAVANLLIDSMRNLVRADGGYVFVQLMGTINATFLKLIGIAIYFRFGVMPYLYFYIFASVPILVCFIIRCKQYFSVKYLQLTPMFRKIWDARYLWLKSDLEYIRANADSLLISLLFPAAIMGTYTVYKSIEQIMKNFIEGFFDVLSQNTVCYKGDRIALENQEHKIKIIRNLVVIVIILGTIIYAANMSWWTRLINLQHYEGIDIFILCVALTSIIYLLGKYEINAIAFLAETKMNFKLALITAVLATMTYLVIAVMPTTTVIVIQRVLVYLFPTVVAVYLFQKNKMNIYGKINH